MSARLGLEGYTGRSGRDLRHSRHSPCEAHGRPHSHVSPEQQSGSVELVRWGKERGINVTAEVCSHHISLTEDEVEGYNTNAKMNPPLRTQVGYRRVAGRTGRRHNRFARDRSRAASLRRERARIRRRTKWHRGTRNRARRELHVACSRPGVLTLTQMVERDELSCRRQCSTCRAVRCARARSADVTVFDPTIASGP